MAGAQARLKWGILGTGGIATKFARGLAQSRTGTLLAVGSRSAAAAESFRAQFDAARSYASYEAVLADREVDAVYIGLPNRLHAYWTIHCAEAGKHILCEKPLATNYPEAMVAIEAVREHGVFMMEAFMYRCHPQTARLVELLRAGAIGQVRLIQASFAYNLRGMPQNIRMSNELAGGGIMDVGCYPMSMARLLAGAQGGVETGFADPLEVVGVGQIGAESRVDEWANASVRFAGGLIASLTTGMQVAADNTLRIYGSEGHIRVPIPWAPGERSVIIVHRDADGRDEEIAVESAVPLYACEADAVAQNVADGRQQAASPCMTWADTLGNMKALDQWRRCIGLTFDNEKPAALRLPVSARPARRRVDAPMAYGKVVGIDQPVARIVLGSTAFRPGMLAYTLAMMDHYIEQGGNMVDTAWVYGNESVIGEALRTQGLSDRLMVLAKGAHTPFCTPEWLTTQLHQSLDRLGLDHVDLYLMHRDNLEVPVGEFVDVLNEHKNAGLMRAFGGSNWTTMRLEEANAYAAAHGLAGFAVSSPNLALATWNVPMWDGCIAASDEASRAWYTRTRLPLFAWSSQASGLVTGRYRPEDRDDPALAAVVRTWFNAANFSRLERIKQLAEERGLTPAQIGLAWVLCQPFPTHALIGPQTIDEMRDSLAALSVQLTPREMRWLNLEED
ncbi:MAG: Gfo/Idh/MocA family oxidoreductase [Chloroflexi bacterium]|nr:Gfo/Idh/MocA family oxidoreductase [Chloroflexota bacterium]